MKETGLIELHMNEVDDGRNVLVNLRNVTMINPSHLVKEERSMVRFTSGGYIYVKETIEEIIDMIERGLVW